MYNYIQKGNMVYINQCITTYKQLTSNMVYINQCITTLPPWSNSWYKLLMDNLLIGKSSTECLFDVNIQNWSELTVFAV